MPKNVTKIKILANERKPFSMPLSKALELCLLRTARKEGDVESVNNTQLGRLRDNNINFEIIKEE